MKEIFITGGAGYVGSHCVISLIENGYKPIIIDNFSNSKKDVVKKLQIITKKKIIFYKVDLRNKKKLNNIFSKHNCYCVIHCAGLKSVAESTKNPLLYIENNIASTISLLECMKEHGIFKIIFSSSATVYNSDQTLPLKETALTGQTTNPYGTTKFLIERVLKDVSKFDKNWSITIARYFNPISNHTSAVIKENPIGSPNNLIPIIAKVAQKKINFLKVFGKNYQTKDGTCIRDYIHVMDLANGHVAILNKKLKKGFEVYNFGTGKGYSVLEIINCFEKYTGKPVPYKFANRRKGDVAISLCNTQKSIKKLNWKAIYSLKDAMKDLKKSL
ncbi:UDP-glucose 4-epimerase GalE [Candidatus Pelagibacter bacterium]|nr:UDP-glucose 4-epimerase GalE [Candidatus Pelagibacter bacterium]MDA8805006.1 UDP-glucose 4-epimerase GalE [Candidatus Pelagibacter bacterium]